MPRLWQDLQIGEGFTTGSLTVTKTAILEFAAEFDPQPYHLDSDAGDASIFGGLCASGWQVSALAMRLLTEAFRVQDVAILGLGGVRAMRWKAPVFAEDSLSATINLTASNAASEGAGSIEAAVQVNNQHNKTVLTLSASLLIAQAIET